MENDIRILFHDNKTIVEINNILFSGKRRINWDGVEEYLKGYIGKSYVIKDTGDEIFIGSDFPDEYAHSKYSAKIYGAIAKAKSNASQAIAELIQFATEVTYRPNLEQKHMNDAINGWYRCTVFFSIPKLDDKGNVMGKNVFRGRLIIRCNKDKKKYLYDIIDIKKET